MEVTLAQFFPRSRAVSASPDIRFAFRGAGIDRSETLRENRAMRSTDKKTYGRRDHFEDLTCIVLRHKESEQSRCCAVDVCTSSRIVYTRLQPPPRSLAGPPGKNLHLLPPK